MHEYMTAREAAESLGVSYPTLMVWIRKGKVEVVRRGYQYFVHQDEVERLRSTK